MAKKTRLDKFLCDSLNITRKEAKEAVKKGKVTINGEVVKKPECKLDADDDQVEFEHQPVIFEQFHYLMLHKPQGVVSATKDNHDKTVIDLIHEDFKDKLFPVGRLDKDTEGLLLLTDDGMLAHELLAPGKHVDKTYFVRVEGNVTPEAVAKLEEGVDIGEAKLTMPAKAEIVGGSFEAEAETFSKTVRVRRENLPEVYTELYLTIHEGKFHQVKRMMEAVGTPVIYLKRLSMGTLTLPDDLKKGECRPLTEKEVTELKESVKR